jgi:hypothetical protein
LSGVSQFTAKDQPDEEKGRLKSNKRRAKKEEKRTIAGVGCPEEAPDLVKR